MTEISVVIPVYKCDKCLWRLYERLTATLQGMGVTYELVFVEDLSPDSSWPTLSAIARQDSAVKAYKLSRNFGQHAAITAGLAQTNGQWAVVMDCDLEDPPEEIPRLYREAQDGFDVVFAKRRARQHSLFRRLASKVYFALLGVFSKTVIVGEYANLSIISRKVIDAFLRVTDLDRQYLLILYWLGFKSTAIEYDQENRFHGRSSYTLRALIAHAFNGLFFQTTVFLHWIVYLGFGISLLGLLLAAIYVYRYFVLDVTPGWTTLIVVHLLLGGFIITSTGISALYIAKVFQEVKGRPLFVIDRAVIERQEADFHGAASTSVTAMRL